MDPVMKAALEEAKALLQEHAARESARCIAGKSSLVPAAATAVSQEILRREPLILSAVELFAGARVVKAKLILSGQQPIPRVVLKVGRKTVTVDPHAVLVDVAGWLDGHPDRDREMLRRAFEAVDPAVSGVLAGVRADVANAVSRALADESVVGPIRTRLERLRALEKARALEGLRAFYRSNPCLSKDDVVRTWDEVVVARVMES